MKTDYMDTEAVAALAVGSLDDVSFLLAESLIERSLYHASSKSIANEAIKKAMQ